MKFMEKMVIMLCVAYTVGYFLAWIVTGVRPL